MRPRDLPVAGCVASSARRSVMHMPPIPAVENADPEIARLIQDEARRQYEKVRLIPSENYVSVAVLEASGHGADQQVLRGLPGPPLLRGPAVHRPDRDDSPADRAQALFGVDHANVQPYSGSPANLAVYLAFAPAGRHGDGHGAADGRPPHPRLVGVGDRQVVPAGAVRGPRTTPAGSTSTRCATWPSRSGRRSSSAAARRSRARSTSRPSPRSPPRSGAVLVADIAHIAGLIAGRRPPVAGRVTPT